MKLFLATHNKGKIKEIQQLLENTGCQVITQVEGIAEVEETGATFIENALLKARHAAELMNLPVIADDSGLVVPALNDEPGVYSARYAGKDADAQKNIQKLLKNMEEKAVKSRNAYFYCVIVLMRYKTDPCPIICEGKWDGKILISPKGSQGFGYDPIFFDETYQCSAAELPFDIKNAISHRGQAIKKLIDFL